MKLGGSLGGGKSGDRDPCRPPLGLSSLGSTGYLLQLLLLKVMPLANRNFQDSDSLGPPPRTTPLPISPTGKKASG